MAVKGGAYTVVWSPRALHTYETILHYIADKFGQAEILKFIKRTVTVIEYAAYDPNMFRLSEKGKNKHIVVITRQTTLYYRVKPRRKEIELLLFWDTRMNPSKIKY